MTVTLSANASGGSHPMRARAPQEFPILHGDAVISRDLRGSLCLSKVGVGQSFLREEEKNR